MKPALSTVACPSWTLTKLMERIESWGFLGCELRTFGYGSTQFACDPALTSAQKVRAMFDSAGVRICSLATSIAFDAPIIPPVIGRVICDTEQSVREAKSMIDLAVQLECPFVRVFGFELPSEPRSWGVARVVDRLSKAADACRNSGVRLLLENGGSFPTAVTLAEVLDKVDSPMLAAAYSVAVAQQAGESPEAGLNVLGDRCEMIKLKDMRGATPVALGDGDLHCKEAVLAAAKAGFGGWVVHEFDAAWLSGGADADAVLSKSAKTLFAWTGQRVFAHA